jgi:serine/threonine protein kinase
VSDSHKLQAGTVFARDFKVVKLLREGGMGAVYIAEQLSTGRQRALKLMVPELVDNPEIRDRFVREAKIAANIESDHVVETVTAGLDEETGAPYLVMELLRGEELADAVARIGPITVADVVELYSQIGHALEQAHAQGLVHRDLKPENIFLAASKRREVPYTAKILDFGIAKLVADGMQKTGTQPLGSPLYMAPEQTDRKGRICPGTDVWALGLIAFSLLTGQSFWLGAQDDSLPTCSVRSASTRSLRRRSARRSWGSNRRSCLLGSTSGSPAASIGT